MGANLTKWNFTDKYFYWGLGLSIPVIAAYAISGALVFVAGAGIIPLIILLIISIILYIVIIIQLFRAYNQGRMTGADVVIMVAETMAIPGMQLVAPSKLANFGT